MYLHLYIGYINIYIFNYLFIYAFVDTNTQ